MNSIFNSTEEDSKLFFYSRHRYRHTDAAHSSTFSLAPMLLDVLECVNRPNSNGNAHWTETSADSTQGNHQQHSHQSSKDGSRMK